MFSFLHLSDIHLPASETETSYGVSPHQRLGEVISSFDKLEYPPSFVVITGDLSAGSSLEGYESVMGYTEQLKKRGIRTIFTMGNHDDRDNFRKVFGEKPSSGPVHYRVEVGGLQILVLDTLNTSFQLPRDRLGFFEGEQLKWLSEVLNEDPLRPTVIALHHPLLGSPHKMFSGSLFDDGQRDEFREVISGNNVLALLCGHLHHSQVTTVNGVLQVQAGSTVTELNVNEAEYWLKNTSSYNQIFYTEGNLFVQTIAMPSDGRVLVKGPIQDLLGR